MNWLVNLLAKLGLQYLTTMDHHTKEFFYD
jgi:hypothetical protein